MSDTIFDKIVSGEMQSWKVWEDDNYLAFLTPFPSTPGLTIVIPKENPGDYVFDVNDDVYVGLMAAVRKVAKHCWDRFGRFAFSDNDEELGIRFRVPRVDPSRDLLWFSGVKVVRLQITTRR